METTTQIKENILKKSNNIGSLCKFINNHDNYLNYLNDNITKEILHLPINEKLWYYLNNIKIIQDCDCGKHKSFISFKNGYRKTCGNKKCFVKHRKITNRKKYGVDNPMKSREVQQKQKQTIINKFGVEHPMQSEVVRSKFKKTMLKKHGVEWAQQSKKISDKSVETFSNNPDKAEIVHKRSESFRKTYSLNSDEIKTKKETTIIKNWGSLQKLSNHIQRKIKESSINKHGTTHHLSDKEIINKRVLTYQKNKLKKIITHIPDGYDLDDVMSNSNKTDTYINILHHHCGEIFNITRQLFYKRITNNIDLCLICNPISNGTSQMEEDIKDFIKGFISIEENYKLDKKEIDIFIPDLNIGIEFNGLYWHSELFKDKNYHLNKTELCDENDISLFHIWEDNWLYKQDIVESMILNKIGKTPNKIYARKTEIKEITDTKLISKFLDENHLQGKVGSKIKLGLFYDDELVSLMTFGNLRKNLGQKSSNNHYELLRFCNKKYTNIIGGASRLFKYFIKNYKPLKIISYASRDHSIGKLYETLGFKLDSITKPNYYYIDKSNYIRLNRFNFRKDILIKEGYDSNMSEREIMLERNYYRIYDTGNYKYIFNI